MYPVLVVAGGLSTLTYDYRARFWIAFKRSAGIDRRSQRSSVAAAASVTEDNNTPIVDGEVELQPTLSSRCPAVIPITPAETDNPVSVSAIRQTASIRRRTNTARSAVDPTSTTIGGHETTGIVTPSIPVAVVVGVLLAAGIVVLVVVRAKTSNPTRALDFLTNMVIAGVIIFGVSFHCHLRERCS